MIKIYADGNLIYDSRLRGPGKDYTLLGLKTTTALNKGGTAEIVMPPGHPGYSALTSYRSIVEMYRDSVLRFRGRALYPVDDWQNNRTWTCEGELCFFQDAVSRPYLYQDEPANIFASVVQEYNSQVEPFKRFKVGEVTVTDANDYVRLESETAEQVLDTLNKLLSRCGGYIHFSTDDDGGRVVNWYADLNNRSGQVIEFGENLLDFSRNGASTDLITGVIPYGAKDEATGARITISGVNNGMDYIVDDAAVTLRGTILKPVIWDDVTQPDNLLTKAERYLHEHVQIVTSLQLSSVDLSYWDKTIDSYKVGDIIRVRSKPHAVDDDFQLTERVEDWLNPNASTVNLGKDIRTLTGANVASDKQSQSDLHRVQQEIITDYKINTADSISSSENKIQSMIKQNVDEITAEVSALKTVTDEQGSQIDEMSSKVDAVMTVFDLSGEDLSFNVPVSAPSMTIGGVQLDYIVEQGQSNDWTYRKWHSGIMECWKTIVYNTAINNQLGSLYLSPTATDRQSYPFQFTRKPIEQVSAQCNHPAWIISASNGEGVNDTNSTGRYHLCSHDAYESVEHYLSFYVIGYWK